MPEGLGSMGASSIGDAAVDARRTWRAERQVRQRGVGAPVFLLVSGSWQDVEDVLDCQANLLTALCPRVIAINCECFQIIGSLRVGCNGA